jgi:membrane-associated phospholipid phosphatase
VHPEDDTTRIDPYNWQLLRGFPRENFRSFPSGHTTAAFAAAAAVTNETVRWWPKWQWAIGTAMFGGATMLGLSRMYNNRHWASDVVLGAAIGTFAGDKVVRFNHRTHPNNSIDRWLLNIRIAPTAEGSRSVSLSILPDFR